MEKFIGKIIYMGERRSGVSASSGNSWEIQEFCAVEIAGSSPRHLVFSIFGQDRLDKANIKMGAVYTINWDVDGREYNGRWYADIRAISVAPFSLDGPTDTPQISQPVDTQHQADAFENPFA